MLRRLLDGYIRKTKDGKGKADKAEGELKRRSDNLLTRGLMIAN